MYLENILSVFKILFWTRKIGYNFLKTVFREHQPNNKFKYETHYFINIKQKTIFKYSYQTVLSRNHTQFQIFGIKTLFFIIVVLVWIIV